MRRIWPEAGAALDARRARDRRDCERTLNDHRCHDLKEEVQATGFPGLQRGGTVRLRRNPLREPRVQGIAGSVEALGPKAAEGEVEEMPAAGRGHADETADARECSCVSTAIRRSCVACAAS
eukprot:212992-Heterocapsa_arctica.AAC.1